MEVDLTNVKSGVMSRTRGSARVEGVYKQRKCKSRGSAQAEGVHERRECAGGGRAE